MSAARSGALNARTSHPCGLRPDITCVRTISIQTHDVERVLANIDAVSLVLIKINSPGVGRINGRKPKTFGIIGAKALDLFRDIHTAYSKGYFQICKRNVV